MFKIKDLTKEIISSWNTSELTQNFNDTKHKHNTMSEYLSSNEVRYCDAINVLEKIDEIREQFRINSYNLSDIHNEVIKRINTLGKRVYLFGDDKVFTSYVLPKCNNDDSMAFIICNNNEVDALYSKEYTMYLNEDIINLNYRIDRKTDNSIKWHNYFPKYDELIPYRNESYEKYYISKYNKKYGFVDENGLGITPMKYDYAYSFNYNLAKVEINKKWGIVDYDGNELVECKYDDIIFPKYFKPLANNPIIVRIDYKFGIINDKGDIVLPVCYKDIEFFGEDMIRVNNNDKFMLFDWDGKPITKLEYERISYLNEHLIEVGLNGYTGVINKSGEEIVAPTYFWIEDFENGLARMKSEYGYGFINELGKVLIPAIYTKAYIFDNDFIVVSKNGKYGLMDIKGRALTSIIYDNIRPFNDELIKVTIEGKDFFINKEGIEVVEA